MHNRTASFDIDVVYQQCLDRGFTQTLDNPIRVNKEILIVAGFIGSPTTAQCGCTYVGKTTYSIQLKHPPEPSTPRLRSPFVVLHCSSKKKLAQDQHVFNLSKTLEFLHNIIDEIPKLHRQHDCIHLFPS